MKCNKYSVVESEVEKLAKSTAVTNLTNPSYLFLVLPWQVFSAVYNVEMKSSLVTTSNVKT